jgi:two-component sensor histidine kinase/PAS domain-containing protein
MSAGRRTRVEEVIAALPIAAAVFHPVTLRLRSASPSFLDLFGNGPGAGAGLTELFPALGEPGGLAAALDASAALTRVVRAGEAGRGGAPELTVEMRRLRRDGGVLVTVSPAPSGAAQAEAASPAGHVLVRGGEGWIVEVNAAAARVLGRSRERILGRRLVDLGAAFRPVGSAEGGSEPAPPFPPLRVLETGLPVPEEPWHVETPEGELRTLLVAAAPVPGRSGKAAVACWLDATEQSRRLAEARRELAGREVRVHEANHRVKNTLQIVTGLLGLEIARTRDAAARQALRQAYGRLLAAGRVHRRLYEGEGAGRDRVALDGYLAEVADDVRETVAPERPDEAPILSVQVAAVEVAPDLALTAALVATELLTNAFKYGAPERGDNLVRLEARVEDGHLEIVVSDRGRGLPPGFDPAGSRGMGMQLISTLVEHVEGHFEASGGRGGARFRVRLPLG